MYLGSEPFRSYGVAGGCEVCMPNLCVPHGFFTFITRSRIEDWNYCRCCGHKHTLTMLRLRDSCGNFDPRQSTSRRDFNLSRRSTFRNSYEYYGVFFAAGEPRNISAFLRGPTKPAPLSSLSCGPQFCLTDLRTLSVNFLCFWCRKDQVRLDKLFRL